MTGLLVSWYYLPRSFPNDAMTAYDTSTPDAILPDWLPILH
jgi:hypothetical protein